MTQEELKQVAIDYLGKGFKGMTVSPYLVSAAIAIVLEQEPLKYGE